MIMYKDVVRMLGESVEALGADYVYEKPETSVVCLYIHTTDDSDEGVVPGCIVGDMLVRQHILTLSDLSAIQSRSTGAFSEIHDDVADFYGDIFSDKAKQFLDDVQKFQDHGTPWGESVLSAREDMDYYGPGRYKSEEEGETYISRYYLD